MGIRLGLIGYGFLGRAIAMGIHEGKAGDARLVAVLDKAAEKYREDESAYPWGFTGEAEAFLAEEMDLVVEAAGQPSVRQFAVEVLRSGRDLLTMSVGAFADDALLKEVKEAAIASGKRVIIPSGAIGGLDIISAAAIGELDEVVVTTNSPGRGARSSAEGHQADFPGQAEAACIFSGATREAVKLYPHSINIHAAVSLAGIGLDRTQSRICVDPSLERNRQEIEARGYFGHAKISLTNSPMVDYRLTGRIVVLSVLKTIRNLTSPFVVGL